MASELSRLLATPDATPAVCAFFRERISADLEELTELCTLLNSSYRAGVEKTRQRRGDAGVAIPVEELLRSSADCAIVTELEMVDQVFIPALLATAPDLPLSVVKNTLEWVSRDSEGSSAFLLDLLLIYFETLLKQQIYPHSLAQKFAVGLAVHAKRFEVLRQLVHYHVILDSIEISDLLFALSSTGVPESVKKWARQISLDIVWRSGDVQVIARSLVERVGSPEWVVPMLQRLYPSSDRSFSMREYLVSIQAKLDEGELSAREMDALIDAVVDYLHDPFVEGHMNVADCAQWISLESPLS